MSQQLSERGGLEPMAVELDGLEVDVLQGVMVEE